MRTSKASAFLWVIASAILATFAASSKADTTTGVGPANVKHDTSMAGSGTTAAPIGIRKDCSATQILKWSGTSWDCAADAAGTGDITDVIAGSGLSGGASSGAATITLNLGAQTCTASSALTAVTSTGAFTCSTVGDITGVTAGTGLSGGATSGNATLAVSIAGASCAASEAVTAIGATGTGTCTTVGDITSVGATAGMGLTGGATSGAATLGLISTCADGQLLKSGGTGTSWGCANDNDSGGDITSVVAGSGLTGGATSGAATLTLNMTALSCSAGQHISAVTAIGGFTCTADAGGITNAAGNNIVMKSDGTNAVASSMADNGSSIQTNEPVISTSYLQSGASVYGGGNNAIIYLSSGVGGVGLVPGLNCEYNTSGTATCYDNWVGYLESTSAFRTKKIGNGKSAAILTVEGPSSHIYYSGSAPALTGCNVRCSLDTSATDERGTITCSDGPNACIVTFATGYTTNAPSCTVSSTSTSNTYLTSAPTTSAMTVSTTTTGTQTITYHCDGRLAP